MEALHAIWLRAHIELQLNPKSGPPRTSKWVPNFDHKPTPVWKPGAPCGFEAAARYLIKQETIMKQGHKSSLMLKEWKIEKNATSEWEKIKLLHCTTNEEREPPFKRMHNDLWKQPHTSKRRDAQYP